MIHLGDITKIKGSEVALVDVITGGSPCQDLSVAGKRKGLAGERSGLFMEQMRLIKEMRNESEKLRMQGADEPIRPRYMVWENVYGAFSSNNGEDFRAVLEEVVRVKNKDADIPGPPKEGWPRSGFIMGDGFSVAWRGHDAQFWGVPQRRKRICVLADFDGDSAGKILFENELWGETADGNTYKIVSDSGAINGCEIQSIPQSVSGHSEPGGKEGEGFTRYSEVSSGETGSVIVFNRERCGAVSMQDMMPTLQAAAGESGNNQPMVCVGTDMYNQSVSGDVAVTLNAHLGPSGSHSGPTAIVYGMSSMDSNAMKSPNPNSGIYEADTARTLDLNGANPACNQGGMMVYKKTSHAKFKGDGQGWTETETNDTLNAFDSGETRVPTLVVGAVESHPQDSRVKINEDGINQTISGNMEHDPANGGLVVTAFIQNQRDEVRDLGERSGTLHAEQGTHEQTFLCIENHPNDSRVKIREDGVVQTLDARMGLGGGNVPMVANVEPVLLESNQNHATIQTNGISTTLSASMGMGGGYVPMVAKAVNLNGEEVSNTIVSSLANANVGSTQDRLNIVETYQESPVIGLEVYHCETDSNIAQTLKARDFKDPQCVSVGVVRRLTPTECALLQGFPPHWMDIGEWVDSKGKLHKDADAPKYKAAGNSIALPFWQYLAFKIRSYLGDYPTMASLFDGIGGFPLTFSRAGIKPLWASEIEEFPIAVTKRHFKENGEIEIDIRGEKSGGTKDVCKDDNRQ